MRQYCNSLNVAIKTNRFASDRQMEMADFYYDQRFQYPRNSNNWVNLITIKYTALNSFQNRIQWHM